MVMKENLRNEEAMNEEPMNEGGKSEDALNEEVMEENPLKERATEEIIIAGFGGQGVMSMGQLMTYAGMSEGKHVSWLPSYGPEQRGGTANCAVVISDESVGSPVVTQPTTAIVLNNPSFDKFEPLVRPGGVLIVNESLIDKKSERTDIHTIYIDATKLANELGHAQIANSIILGAFVEQTQVISSESVIEALKNVLSQRKHHLIPLNEEALQKGRRLVRDSMISSSY